MLEKEEHVHVDRKGYVEIVSKAQPALALEAAMKACPDVRTFTVIRHTDGTVTVRTEWPQKDVSRAHLIEEMEAAAKESPAHDADPISRTTRDYVAEQRMERRKALKHIGIAMGAGAAGALAGYTLGKTQ